MTVKGLKLHFIAIGGAVMHGLALDMSRQGAEVSGSDDQIYEPSRTALKDADLLPAKLGWNPRKIHADLDYVILGMHAHEDNPELARALELGISVLSFPEFVGKLAAESTQIVIAGSHGKTTISAMLIHFFNDHGLDFDYLLGAEVPGVKGTVRMRGAPLTIIEGDEYLSSRIDGRPKFLHYDPDILVLTGIAWDHINVFPTFQDYRQCFSDLLTQIRNETQLFYCGHDEGLIELVKDSERQGQPYLALKRVTKSSVELDGNRAEINIIGFHNDQNLSAAAVVIKALGYSAHQFLESISSFRGARKRLERLPSEKKIVYIDYAHAPSKLRASLKAVAQYHADEKILAMYELHTYSSMNRDFIEQYRDCLKEADQAVVFYDEKAVAIKRMSSLSDVDIRKACGQDDIRVLHNREELESFLVDTSDEDWVYLFMSSGKFDRFDVRKWAKEA